MRRPEPHESASAASAPNEAPAADASLWSLLERWSRRRPESDALAAPGRRSLTYRRLLALAKGVARVLESTGLHREDRVAISLPNGPEMAVAFVAVSATSASAPLNPAYRAEELDFSLSDLEARAIVVPAGLDSPARTVARERGLTVLELAPDLEKEAGSFTLTAPRAPRPGRAARPARKDDVALLLHTSGTTSRPKLVALTHGNLLASAGNVARVLQLTPKDRCLNMMPLFHIHGLVGALLSSLSAGASVACTPGFYAPRFFEWMEELRPSWYTAVPTMHQAIIARAGEHRELLARSPLRLIRSSSSFLPPRLMAELENVFGVPVLESYGMTEASHQMTSNPLPPLPRKPGSVGVAAGSEIAILGEAGEPLPPGQPGEVVIRGTNVTRGYEKNPAANEQAFVRGWFRTGDQGVLDPEGYLFLTGRLKELINRGGEKISPREIDEALLDHPAVAQCLAFAVPDPRLGEEVAAAVVLREGAAATERELRDFAANRLADFKVPRRIVFVGEIPRGPTGKLQRIGLAQKFGIAALDSLAEPEERAPHVPPRTPLEEAIAAIWGDVLRVKRIGVQDSFFFLGGDSVLATQVVSRMREAFQVELPLVRFFETPTVAVLAASVEQLLAEAELEAAGDPAVPAGEGMP